MRLTLTALIRKVGGDGIETGVPKWSRIYANLPERYIMRKTRAIRYTPPVRGTYAYDQDLVLTPPPRVGMDRPWTANARRNSGYGHAVNKAAKLYVQPIPDKDWM